MKVDMAAQGSFEFALIQLKSQRAMTRAGWNGKGQFVYLVEANQYEAQTGVAQMAFPRSRVPYDAYFALKNAQGSVSVWVPSVGDLLAQDWEEVDLVPIYEAALAES
ncbi:hypothetical protein [Xanthomonas virus PB119]|nr:hypothetical protein [Xanthomonas virus PB119]